MKHSPLQKKGFGLIEILVGSAIIVTGILALSEGYVQYMKFALANEKNIQAAYLAEEGLEAMTYLRDWGWTAKIKPLSTTTPYQLYWTGSYWTTVTTNQYVDGIFLREITIADVKRDGNGKIATTGTYDPNTKLVTATLSYVQGHATTSKSISTYISNINAD
jgi:Tfp pilus assembly protein PilV